jgi:hypothetical protein
MFFPLFSFIFPIFFSLFFPNRFSLSLILSQYVLQLWRTSLCRSRLQRWLAVAGTEAGRSKNSKSQKFNTNPPIFHPWFRIHTPNHPKPYQFSGSGPRSLAKNFLSLAVSRLFLCSQRACVLFLFHLGFGFVFCSVCVVYNVGYGFCDGFVMLGCRFGWGKWRWVLLWVWDWNSW